MIEVGQDAQGGWAFTFISAEGRVLIYADGFGTQAGVLVCAKAMREVMWARSDEIDHRMGACI